MSYFQTCNVQQYQLFALNDFYIIVLAKFRAQTSPEYVYSAVTVMTI